MEPTIYVDCPCCGTRIEAIRESGRVIQHWKKAEKSASGDPIKDGQERLKAEKERLSKLLSNPGKILEEQKRQAMEKFDREKERIKREGDTTRPPHPFDLD